MRDKKVIQQLGLEDEQLLIVKVSNFHTYPVRHEVCLCIDVLLFMFISVVIYSLCSLDIIWYGRGKQIVCVTKN